MSKSTEVISTATVQGLLQNELAREIATHARTSRLGQSENQTQQEAVSVAEQLEITRNKGNTKFDTFISFDSAKRFTKKLFGQDTMELPQEAIEKIQGIMNTRDLDNESFKTQVAGILNEHITTASEVGIRGVVKGAVSKITSNRYVSKALDKAMFVYRAIASENNVSRVDVLNREKEAPKTAVEKITQNLATLRNLDNIELQELLTETSETADKLGKNERRARQVEAIVTLAARGVQAGVTTLTGMQSAPVVAGLVQGVKDFAEIGINKVDNSVKASEMTSGEAGLETVQSMIASEQDADKKQQIMAVMNYLVVNGYTFPTNPKEQETSEEKLSEEKLIKYRFASPAKLLKWQKEIRDKCNTTLTTLTTEQGEIANQIINSTNVKLGEMAQVQHATKLKIVTNMAIATAGSFAGQKVVGFVGDRFNQLQEMWNNNFGTPKASAAILPVETQPTPSATPSSSPSPTPSVEVPSKTLIGGSEITLPKGLTVAYSEDGTTLITGKTPSETIWLGEDGKIIPTTAGKHWEFLEGETMPTQVDGVATISPETLAELKTSGVPIEGIETITPKAPETPKVKIGETKLSTDGKINGIGKAIYDYENIAKLSSGKDGVTLATYKDGSTLLIGSDGVYIETKTPDTHWELKNGIPIEAKDSKIIPTTTPTEQAKNTALKTGTGDLKPSASNPKAIEATKLIEKSPHTLDLDGEPITFNDSVGVTTNAEGNTVITTVDATGEPRELILSPDGEYVSGYTKKEVANILQSRFEDLKNLDITTKLPIEVNAILEGITTSPHELKVNGSTINFSNKIGVTELADGNKIITTYDGKTVHKLFLDSKGKVTGGDVAPETLEEIKNTFTKAKIDPTKVVASEPVTTAKTKSPAEKTPAPKTSEVKIGATTETRIGTNLRSFKTDKGLLVIGRNPTDAILLDKNSVPIEPKVGMHWELGKDGKIIEVKGSTTIPPQMLKDLESLNFKTTGIKATEVVPVTPDSIKEMNHTLKIGDKEIKLPDTAGVRPINGNETAITTLGKGGKTYELVIGKNGEIIDGQVSPEIAVELKKNFGYKLAPENIATAEAIVTPEEALEELKNQNSYRIPEGNKTATLPVETYNINGKTGTYIRFDRTSLADGNISDEDINDLYKYIREATGGKFSEKDGWSSIEAMKEFFDKTFYGNDKYGVAEIPRNKIVKFNLTKITSLGKK